MINYCTGKQMWCEFANLNGFCSVTACQRPYSVTYKAYGTKPVTNDDRINSMTIEEKAEFLSKIAYERETPWSKPFAEKFCASCPEPEYTLEDGSKMRLHECDFSDGVCPHGGDIVWWLKQTAEEDGTE